MTDLQKFEIPFSAFRIFAFASLIFFAVLVLSSEIPVGDMHAILNTYIIIEIAIISVAFVAMSIKQNEIRKETYSNLIALVIFSSIILFLDVLAYFYSFIKSSSYLSSSISLAMVTWLTFLSLFMMIMVFLEFFPKMEETAEQPKLE